MDIEKLTIGEAREIARLVGGYEKKPTPFEVGAKWFFRTVTHYLTGEIVAIYGDFLVLDTAAWIADTGRFADALRKHEFNEVEPMGDGVVLNATTIIDAKPWAGQLPTVQK